MGTSTRQTIMQEMARENQLYGTGTSTTCGTATTLLDTVNRKEPEDWWNEGSLVKTGGTGSGDVGRISKFANATSTLTIYQSQTAPTTTTTYDLYRPPFPVEFYRNAIGAARDEAYAMGFARRGWDETLWSTRQHWYDLPTTLEEVGEVYLADNRYELLPDNDWAAGGLAFTRHADASFTNNGRNGERTLRHIITGANQVTRIDVGVSAGVEYAFRAEVRGDTTGVTAYWRYQYLNSTGGTIGSITNFATRNSTTFGLITGTTIAPSNAAQIRVQFGSSSTGGTIYTFYHSLYPRGRLLQIPKSDWRVVWEGNTGRLDFVNRPPRNRPVLIKGRRVLETLSADSDTISFDEPESRAFIYLACAKMWAASLGQIPDIDRGQAGSRVKYFMDRFNQTFRGNYDNWKTWRQVATPIVEEL